MSKNKSLVQYVVDSRSERVKQEYADLIRRIDELEAKLKAEEDKAITRTKIQQNKIDSLEYTIEILDLALENAKSGKQTSLQIQRNKS